MKERMELPDGWVEVKLGEVCDVVTGNTPSKSDVENFGNDVPFIKPPNLQNSITGSTEEMLSQKGARKSRLVPENSVLVTCIGNLGRTGLTSRISAFNQQINAILENGAVTGKFLFYQAQSPSFRLQLEDLAAATTVPIVNKGKFESITIVIPPLPEQHRIVAKIEALFTSLDRGITSLKTAQQQLKIYRQAVLKWAFEGKLTNEGVKDGELPEGWKWVKIDDIAHSLDHMRKPINKNERQKRQGNIPYYGANGRTGWIDDFLFDEPLILVVEDETFVGRQAPFSYKIKGKSWVNNHAHILKPKQLIDIDFLNYQLSYYPFLPLTTGTTGRKKLTKNALMNAKVKICNLEEQHNIVAAIESRLSVCDKLEETILQSLQQAEALRQSILKKAFAGQLVPQDPHDEPASVLLERIRAERKAEIGIKTSKTKK